MTELRRWWPIFENFPPMQHHTHTHAPAHQGTTWLTRLLATENIRAAWARVKGNRGAAGIDGVTIPQLTPRFTAEWKTTEARLLQGEWKPLPVRCVEIPKPDGGKRVLGIPAVMDRVVEQSVAQILSPLWEPQFSPRSYAYRPGRSARAAAARLHHDAVAGEPWVVELDIAQFFDRIDHQRLLDMVASRTPEPGFLAIIAAFLAAGAVRGGQWEETPEGTPQGSPLSPLLANIYLTPLDHWLEKQGWPHVRYADDVRLTAPDEAEGKRRLSAVEHFLASELALVLNEEKCRIVPVNEARFLGFCYTVEKDGSLCRAIAPEAIEHFRSVVTELTAWTPDAQWETTVEQLSNFVRGWMAYYQSTGPAKVLAHLRAFARCAARRWQWESWQSPERRFLELRQRGIAEAVARQTMHAAAEQVAAGPVMGGAFPNRFFLPIGFGEGDPATHSGAPAYQNLSASTHSKPATKPTHTAPQRAFQPPLPKPLAAPIAEKQDIVKKPGIHTALTLNLGALGSFTFRLHICAPWLKQSPADCR